MYHRRIVGRSLLVTGAAILLLAVSPAREAMLSYAVMSVFSKWYERDSLMEERGLFVELPEGNRRNGWSPLIVTFHDDRGFSRFAGEEAEFTVMYNIPAFSWETGASELFNSESGKYNGFYGAYLVSWEKEEPFGFTKEGNLKPEEVALAAEYDFRYLVLSNFDPEEEIFEFSIQKMEEDVFLAGESDWVRVVADLTMNGCYHHADEFSWAYLQYGAPKDLEQPDLAPVKMTAVLYGRYDEEWDTSLFLYAICKDQKETFFCEEQFLKKVQIERERK